MNFISCEWLFLLSLECDNGSDGDSCIYEHYPIVLLIEMFVVV